MVTSIDLFKKRISQLFSSANSALIFKITASLSIFIGLIGCIILEWSHVIYTLSMVFNMLGLDVSLTDLAMLMPEKISYDVFALEKVFTPLFIILFLISLIAAYKYLARWKMVLYAITASSMFFVGFYFTGYLAFPAQHYTAKFISVDSFLTTNFKQQEIGTAISSRNRALVLEINGDARAYPMSYITQSHIAGGEKVGGKDVVMTFCGLSHLSVAYANTVNGKDLNLRVMGQFNNNLVMFDQDTHEPIHQIKGKMMFSNSPLKELPSVIMDLDNFMKLYPKGRIYYRAPSDLNIVDRVMYKLMGHSMGEQYNEDTDDLAFDTSPYDDKRLAAKERIYAIKTSGKSIVFTKDFIANQDNDYFEVKFDGKIVAIKYFKDADYIDMFLGSNAQEINYLGILPDGTKLEKYRHINQMLWRVYQNFYPKSIIYQ